VGVEAALSAAGSAARCWRARAAGDRMSVIDPKRSAINANVAAMAAGILVLFAIGASVAALLV
jgi:hypothetical protein